MVAPPCSSDGVESYVTLATPPPSGMLKARSYCMRFLHLTVTNLLSPSHRPGVPSLKVRWEPSSSSLTLFRLSCYLTIEPEPDDASITGDRWLVSLLSVFVFYLFSLLLSASGSDVSWMIAMGSLLASAPSWSCEFICRCAASKSSILTFPSDLMIGEPPASWLEIVPKSIFTDSYDCLV